MAAKRMHGSWRRGLLAAAAGVLLAGAAMAAPPSDVTVDYDDKEGLHVTARHPTDRLDRYYVRLVEVFKNGDLDKTVTFPRQTAAWGIDEHIDYKADPGDRIRVKLYSSEGGTGEAEMTVPVPPAETSPPVMTTPPASVGPGNT